jgi:membrane-associated phospholipid phosphatase
VADPDAARYAPRVGFIARLETLDEDMFARVSRLHAPVLDHTMPALTRVASYSALWVGVAACLAASGPRGRRAAAAGLSAVAVTSFTANVVAKGLSGRPRPVTPVPVGRRLPQPSSSSFPSGHTASAAAFSGVVGHEVGWLRLPLTGVAAAVGFSRVYTGAHYPGDVVAGWLLGRGIAFLARRISARAFDQQ